ncbi:MAG: HD domain-containing phosphohydrolase [Candidatus Dormiibacterota bacterium]
MQPGGREWRRRPVLSAALRSAVVGLPALTALGVAYVLSRALPHPTTVQGILLWYAVMSATMLASIIVVERAARRLLPLAALLNVSLLFPDQAPRRFAVARRVARPRDIKLRLEELRQKAPGSSEVAHMQRILELAAALSVHDRGTRGHSERVRVFTDMIAEEMDLPDHDRSRLRWASLLHDIGKLLVPAEILRKPTTLTEDEWEAIREHPDEGARIIEPLRDWLGPWALAVEQHHERWDGKGYPRGLAGKDISLGGRIVAVADSYEVMTAPRPYRRALGVVAAREELVRCSGAQFDPAVVRAFLNISVGRLWRVVGIGAWVLQVPFLSWFGGLGASWGAAAASGAAAIALGVLPVIPVPASTPTPTPLAVAAVTPTSSPSSASDGSGRRASSTSHRVASTPSAAPTGRPSSTPSSLPATPEPTASGTGLPTSIPLPIPTPSLPPILPTATPRPTPTPTPSPTPTPAPVGPPVVSIGSGSVTLLGAYSASGSFSDANLGTDQFSATVDYGDGGGAQPLSLNGSSFSLSYQYPALGTFTVTVTVTDESDGLQGTATTTVSTLL